MDYDVKGNLHEVLGSLPAGVRLVAISKFHPNEYIEEAYAEGQRIFGESHEQELAKKVASLPEDIEWHFIGHLQTNKVKYIAPYISMIESVDSLKLLKEIEKQAAKHDRVVKVLLELHLAEEDTKSGLSLDACRELLEAGEWRFTVSKTKTPHIVPLSTQAIALLNDLHALTGHCDYVFAINKNAPMSDGTVNKALRRLGWNTQTEYTGHGARAMARTILAERLRVQPEIIEHQLAHRVPDTLGTSYNRTKYLDDRKRMMQVWSDYLDELKEGGKVIKMPLRA